MPGGWWTTLDAGQVLSGCAAVLHLLLASWRLGSGWVSGNDSQSQRGRSWLLMNGYIYVYLDENEKVWTPWYVPLGKLEVWRYTNEQNLQKKSHPWVLWCQDVFGEFSVPHSMSIYFGIEWKVNFTRLFGQLNWHATGYTNIQQTFHAYALGFSCILPKIFACSLVFSRLKQYMFVFGPFCWDDDKSILMICTMKPYPQKCLTRISISNLIQVVSTKIDLLKGFHLQLPVALIKHGVLGFCWVNNFLSYIGGIKECQ